MSNDGPVRVVRARTAHQISDRPPIRVSVGEHVSVGERDGEWPEFVFVTRANGSGWVPARHLSSNSGEAVVRTAYDTTELPTRAGDLLQIIVEDLQSGWLWCRSADGREGWVPVNTVEPAE